MITIKNIAEETLMQLDLPHLRDADLVSANLRGADLVGADLRGADLRDADLVGADLRGADLRDADLAGADLRGAYLRGAYLAGADLRGAYLRGAYLRGAYLASADLTGAKLPPGVIVENLDAKILHAIEEGGTLSMGSWHTCETTHCRAGWAITLAGAEGAELERTVGSHIAGILIYKSSTGNIPDFFASDEAALADIRRCALAEHN